MMDNLVAHKSARVRELIEERAASDVFAPPTRQTSISYETFSKITHSLRKAKARTLEGLFEATRRGSGAA